jgi:integrase
MGGRPSVRWNESKQRWMAWVRFPDGSRRKVERVKRAAAEADLAELIAQRASQGSPEAVRERQLTFGEAIDQWVEAGCPSAAGSRHHRTKSPNTIDNARSLLSTHVLPAIGSLRIERTTTKRVEAVFESMARQAYASSTIDRTWGYLNQACESAVREGRIKASPVRQVMLPEPRPAKQRRSLTIEQVERLVREAIPNDPNPAMWLTGLMCGLRPGELAGLRWPFVDVDTEAPSLEVAERAREVGKRYAGQASPKTRRSRRRIGLHPLLVAALRRHREEQVLLGLYDDEGFVFPTRNGTPHSLTNLRKYFQRLCERAGLGRDWTTYELRHSFVSLVSDQLDDLVKVADLVGHVDTRTTQGYRHAVRPSLPHAIEAWERLLETPASRTAATPSRRPSNLV